MKAFARSGFGLLEVVIAVAALNVLALALIMVVKGQKDTRSQASHQIAAVVAQNEVESLRVAGPVGASAYVGTRLVDARGVEVPDGPYSVSIQVDTVCGGGTVVKDGANDVVLKNACNNTRNATLIYEVSVAYFAGSKANTVRYTLHMSERGRFGNARIEP